MEYIRGIPRNQITFVTTSLEDDISNDNPVRVIDAFIGRLDLDSMVLKELYQTQPADHSMIQQTF